MAAGLCGCVERYYPDETQLKTGSLVVTAHLNNIPGMQTIKLSRSVSIEHAVYQPVSGCFIEVERVDGEVRIFEETEAGSYQGELDEAFLETGMEYQLSIMTADGDRYESAYEILSPAPGIKDVHYRLESMPSSDPALVDQGIRFYVDFDIEKDSGRYLRWELQETFEVHNPDYETRMYDVDRRWYPVYADMKWLRCWLTRDIYEIYTLDIASFSGEIYRDQPLHYVSGSTWHLHHRYSLRVRQYSHSEAAFWYWNELAKNVQSGASLFDAQPALTPSNICNLEDENELVIGYFSISGVSEHRVFVGEVPGLEIYRDPYFCGPGVFPRFLWNYPSDQLPFYVAAANILGVNENGKVQEECVDCRLRKGSTGEKPDFWDR